MIDAIRVLVLSEDGMFVAQCVEYDIGAQAKDVPTLRCRFKAVLSADIEESVRRYGVPFSGIDRAPVCYERMWDAAEPSGVIGRFTVSNDGTDMRRAESSAL